MATPNMGMTLPTDHDSAELWGSILNTALTLNDAHDHSPGKGVLVPMGGIKIDADKSWSFGGTSRAITDLKAIDFAPTAVAGLTALAGALFISDGTGGLSANELYYRTTSGSNVKFTSGAALNVAAFTGGIGGDYTAVGAAVAFDDALDRYTFKQQANAWARMASGEVRILETGTTESVFVGMAAPALLGASYTMTWPTALPGATNIAQIDSSGNWSFSNTIVNSATFSNLVTLNAGATAASGQHFTTAGAGRYKHGTMTLIVPWSDFRQIASGTAVAYSTAVGTPGISGATFTVIAPLTLPVGARILTIRAFIVDNATGPTQLRTTLVSCDTAGTLANAAGPSGLSAGTGAGQTQTLSTINITQATGISYSIVISNSVGVASCSVRMCEVDFDFP